MEVAGRLPTAAGAELLEAARSAFVSGLNVTAAVSAVLALAMAAVAVAVLRQVRTGGSEPAEREAEPALTDG
ncbi:hypothetical protein [Actinomadura hibisca]|uniref:hypothetical protein n=1 Tax=Actinomadura hibisca TaxID=68565 RepID=UPI00082B5FCE|nr:hypothetical protein [Actinomadura hibisca]